MNLILTPSDIQRSVERERKNEIGIINLLWTHLKRKNRRSFTLSEALNWIEALVQDECSEEQIAGALELLIRFNIMSVEQGKYTVSDEFEAIETQESMLHVALKGTIAGTAETLRYLAPSDSSREPSRRDRIAKFLMEHEGIIFTPRELCDALHDTDLKNIQYQAYLLSQENRGYMRTVKDGEDSYAYMGFDVH